jgi:predicted HicB family RNase H-like nuclease
MNTMSYRDYVAKIEYDSEDEVFFGRLAGITDGVGFHSDTVSGLKQAFHDAVDDYLETCAATGKQPQRPYSGKLMFRVDPQVHADAARAAFIAGKSLNQWAEETLAKAAANV